MDVDEFDTSDLDFSGFTAEAEPQGQEETPVQEAPAQETGNPAWNEYLENIPAGMHSLVTPAFQAWDRKVQERFQEIGQQWEPFKKFRDQNIDPEYLERAHSVAQQLQNDPVGVYASLHQFFQQSPQYQQQLIERGLAPAPVQEAADKQQEGLEVQDPSDEVAALRQELEQFKQQQFEALQQQQLHEEYQQTYNETLNTIKADFATIEQRTGTLPESVKAEIIKEAQFLGQQTGKPVSVIEAASNVFRFMQQARSGVKSAPRPVGSGSVPQSPSFDPVTADADSRLEYVKGLVARMQDD